MRFRTVFSVIFSSATAFSTKGGTNSQASRLYALRSGSSLSDNEFRSFDPKDLGVGGTYSIGISAIVPRPIAVITTQSENGTVNCAPFS